jgi:hypothetical protein
MGAQIAQIYLRHPRHLVRNFFAESAIERFIYRVGGGFL